MPGFPISDRRHSTSHSEWTPRHGFGDVGVGGKVIGVGGFDLPAADPVAGDLAYFDGTQWQYAEASALADAEGAVAIRYTFDTTTTDSDPGSGNLRLSNATQYSAVTARCDLADVAGADVTNALDLIGLQTGTTLGYLRLQKTDDPTKWLLATVSAIASPAGYRNVTIANIAKSANSPFANGDAVTLVFVPSTVGLAASSTVPAFSTPAIALGAVAAAGVASTVIRSDATIAAFGTAPAMQAFGDAAVVGTDAKAANALHKHAMPTAAVTSSGLTQATSKLLGRTTAGTGAIEEITPGAGLTLAAGSLSASAAAGATAKGNDLTPALSNAMPPWVKPSGAGVITQDAQGRLTVDSSSAYKAFLGMAFLEARLHLVYRSGTDHVATPDGVIKYRYSDDLGRTWSSATTIATNAVDLRDPNIIALSTGRLLVHYFRYNGNALDVRVIHSDNRGQTWSAEYVVPDTFTGTECGSTGQMIELPDGTIILPGYGTDSGPTYKSVLWTSTDGGLTFGTQTTVASSGSIQYTEWQPRLLASGKIVGLIRDDLGGHTYRVLSTDLGVTWGSVTDVLSSTAGRPDVVEFYPGALLWHGRGTSQRSRWAVSWDEGATWTALQETDSGGTLAAMYHAPVVLAPGYIAVAYSLQNTTTDADLFIRYYHDGYGIDTLGNLTVLSGGGGGVTGLAAPGLTLGTTNTAGAATTVLATDSTIAAFDATVPTTSAIGDAAAAGSVAKAARRDHVHGREALSTAMPLIESGTGAVGTATKSSREDHVHPAAGGSGGTVDHSHVVGEAWAGDGATTVFTLMQEAIDATVEAFVAGAQTDVTLGGMNDQITFAVAPAAAARVRVNYLAATA